MIAAYLQWASSLIKVTFFLTCNPPSQAVAVKMGLNRHQHHKNLNARLPTEKIIPKYLVGQNLAFRILIFITLTPCFGFTKATNQRICFMFDVLHSLKMLNGEFWLMEGILKVCSKWFSTLITTLKAWEGLVLSKVILLVLEVISRETKKRIRVRKIVKISEFTNNFKYCRQNSI